MQDLSALTPPLLVCVVVIIAIVAFLRHEMGRSRSGRPPGEDDTSSPDAQDDATYRSEQRDGADAGRAGADDTGRRA